MTNEKIIQAIREEIKRKRRQFDFGSTFPDMRAWRVLGELLSFLDTLESEKSIDIDFEQELYKHFGQVKDFTLGMRIGQYFYNLCKEQMMEEAVKGIVHPDDCEIWVNLVGYGYKFNDGDKVRIIILPKED